MATTGETRPGLGSGFLWLSAQAVARQVLLFGLFVVLGRLLEPADFGVVAIATAALVILQAVSSQGVTQAVIQRHGLTEHEANVVYTFNLALGAGLTAIALLACALYAWLVGGVGQTVAVLAVMALSMPISALYEVHQARLSRDFRFGLIARKSIAGQAVGSLAAVVAAFSGLGVWSLVIQYYSLVLVELAIVRSWSGWSPRFAADRRVVRDILGLGGYLFAARLVQAIDQRSAELVLGAVAGQVAAGFFRIARSLFDVVIALLGAPLRGLALPLLSSLQKDEAEMRRSYLMLSGANAWLFLAPFGAIAVWAPELVALLFGPKWGESGWMLRVLALQGVVYGLFYLYEPLLVAQGRGRDVFALRVLQTSTLVAALLAGAAFGARAIVIGHTVGTVLAMPIMFVFVRRAIGWSVRSFLRTHAPALLAATAFTGLQLVLRPVTDPAGTVWSLLGCNAAAGLVYLALFWLTADRHLLAEIRRFARRGRQATRST